jgi:hypothetical protein
MGLQGSIIFRELAIRKVAFLRLIPVGQHFVIPVFVGPICNWFTIPAVQGADATCSL